MIIVGVRKMTIRKERDLRQLALCRGGKIKRDDPRIAVVVVVDTGERKPGTRGACFALLSRRIKERIT